MQQSNTPCRAQQRAVETPASRCERLRSMSIEALLCARHRRGNVAAAALLADTSRRASPSLMCRSIRGWSAGCMAGVESPTPESWLAVPAGINPPCSCMRA